MSETSQNQPPPQTPEGGGTSPRRHAAYYGPAPYHGTPRYSGGGGSTYGYGYGAPTAVAPYYGGAGYGPGYGPGYGYGYGSGAAEESDSLLGAVTLTRMLRVCAQRWMTIAVVAVLGSVGAFAVYRTMPSIYQGTSMFEMSLRPKRIITRMENMAYDESLSGQADEIYNTRILKLRSREVMLAVIQRYRSENPSSLVTDEKLIETLSGGTDIVLQRRTRLLRITVRSTSPELSVALANAYVMAIDTYTQDQNREQAERAKDFLRTTVEAQKRDLARRDQEILDFRNANQIDTMEGERKKIESAQLTLNADAVTLETQINRARELVKALETLQGDPDKFGALPDSAPRAEGLVTAHQRLQAAVSERNALLLRLTPSHPEVAAREKQLEQFKQQFADEVTRARDTAKANLDLLLGQLADNRRRCEEIDRKASELEQKIVTAKMKLEVLLRERDVAETKFRDTLSRERDATQAVDDSAATVTIIEKAQMPQDEKAKPRPVSPNPFVILPAGPAIGILIGILFVLLLDHLEDKITGIGDIEHRVRLKVLSVLPHIRRAKREQVAMLSADDRFSHFAEAFAGLRNLLDSPRYSGVSKVLLVVSTQPGEGKTITASNFALSCALTGQRTLLVDFDLRRPRLARIYSKNRKEFESLFHTLSANDPSLYDRLPVTSGHPNLDLACTRPSSELSPSNLLGSGAVASFIDWARQHYDRVVIDSPPFGLVSDAVVLSTLADGVLMMCCPDRTRFRPLKHAVRHLSEAGGHIIGVLVNDVDFGRAGMFGRYEYNYHYAYRYKYGGRYGYGTRPAARGATDAAGATPEVVEPVAGQPAATASAPEKPPAPAPKAAPPQRSVSIDDDDE
jgi:capsular exopolysaccharide synthesis family protein